MTVSGEEIAGQLVLFGGQQNLRLCGRCEQAKPLSEYSTRGDGKPGSYCKPCATAAVAEWRARNPERQAAIARGARERLRGDKPPRKRLTAEERRASALARMRRWRKLPGNAERTREWARQWAQDHPEAAREKERRRRARLVGNGVYEITPKDMRRLLASPCAVCGSRENLHVDHREPLSRGGRHAIGNLQMLCAFHNLSKGARLWADFRRAA